MDYKTWLNHESKWMAGYRKKTMRQMKFVTTPIVALGLGFIMVIRNFGRDPEIMVEYFVGGFIGGLVLMGFVLLFISMGLSGKRVTRGIEEEARELGLSPEQRQQLISKHEKSGVGPFFLNMLLGFGIGSFVQGDKKSGGFQLGFDIGGIVLMIGGAAVSGATGEPEAGIPMMVCGAGFCIGAGITGLITPWVYAANHNEGLEASLNGRTVSIHVAPIVNPMNQQYGLGARVNF